MSRVRRTWTPPRPSRSRSWSPCHAPAPARTSRRRKGIRRAPRVERGPEYVLHGRVHRLTGRLVQPVLGRGREMRGVAGRQRATSSATRPMLYTASRRSTRPSRTARASSVGMRSSGTNTTARRLRTMGTPDVVSLPSSWTTIWHPPKTAADTLSGWPSSAAAKSRIRALSRGRPDSSLPATSPATARRRAAAEPSGERYAVVADDAGPRHRSARLLERYGEAPVDQVGLVRRQLLLALAVDHDAVGVQIDLHSVPDVERHCQAVETGAHVCGRGGGSDGDGRGHRGGRGVQVAACSVVMIARRPRPPLRRNTVATVQT